MFITVHSAIAATVIRAAGITNPAAAFAVGWALHYFGDAVPHGDEKISAWAMGKPSSTLIMGTFFAADMVVLGMVFLLLNSRGAIDLALLATTAGSMVPDVLMGAEMVLHRTLSRPFLWLHRSAHRLTGIIYAPILGVPAQVILAAALWYGVR